MTKKIKLQNRNLRKYLSVGATGELIFADDTSMDIINANIKGFRAICRYDRIQMKRYAKEMSKTHTAQAIFDSLGNYAGFRWVRKN